MSLLKLSRCIDIHVQLVSQSRVDHSVINKNHNPQSFVVFAISTSDVFGYPHVPWHNQVSHSAITSVNLFFSLFSKSTAQTTYEDSGSLDHEKYVECAAHEGRLCY